ncbi:MAG: molybdopterin molybdotransferase MoeA [Alphaproteobacteria bacterium]|nr:molybdopterin molybdotransferase MoeA [Alphaproteobacteria bacterium]
MAQLSDDCFAFGGELITTAAALADLEARIETVAEIETAALPAALGRILAEDIVAARDVPPNPNSAVDGYAVYFDDLDEGKPTVLPVVGRAAAGHPLDGFQARGTAVRIFTGAPMPRGGSDKSGGGPDTVMMQEDCIEREGPGGAAMVEIAAGIKRGANQREAGEDVRAGDTILRAGQRLRPQDLGLAASVGRASLSVYAPLRAAVFSTGDEVRDPLDMSERNADGGDGALGAGLIYDSNRVTIAALLAQLGCAVSDLGILPDDQPTIEAALAEAARDHALIVTSGGMSVGDEDHVRAAVEALGQVHFWRLAIKPGRPIALGQIGHVPFVGLPGNPVAVMVTFLRIARPMILKLAGASDTGPQLFPVRAGFDHKKKKDRREWVRVRIAPGGDGVPVAHKFPRDGAGILTSMVEADGLVELPEDMTRLEAGAMVDFLPFSEVS